MPSTLDRCLLVTSFLFILLSPTYAIAMDCDLNGVDDSLELDLDGDTVIDACDNCLLLANPNQEDTNGDGYGNYCDADLNNDEMVNFADLGLFKGVFLTADADADLNSDGVVNFGDLALMKSSFFQKPGPGPQVLGPNLPGVRAGTVRGNTVAFGSAAEFDVSLITQPQSDVTFLIMSTDESEGIPEINEFTFTPSNWDQRQTVVVRGQNGAPDDNVQDYHITFGPTMSADDAYDGLYMPPVAMKGLSLELVDPPQPINLLANIEEQRGVVYEYTGYGALTFGLTASPTGMSIDARTGLLTWTPQESDEGQSFPITVTVTDGVVNDEVVFQVVVLQPEPLVVTNTETTVAVDDPASSLSGLSISAVASEPQSNFAELGLETIGIDEGPVIPAEITPISDVLVLPDAIAEKIELRFPITELAEGISLNQVHIYSQVLVTHGGGRIWSPIVLDYRYEGTVDNPIYVADLSGLKGLAFIGYHDTGSISAAQPSGQPANLISAESANGISCQAEFDWYDPLLFNYDNYKCTSDSDPEIEITVLHFGFFRWGLVTVEEMAGWLIDAQAKMDALGMAYDKKFTVDIGFPFSNAFDDFSDYLAEAVVVGGYVSSEENFEILHLTGGLLSDPSPEQMQATTVHEYFHHGQSRSALDLGASDLLIDQYPGSSWAIEGQARWFEDYVYDYLDAFRTYGGVPYPPILNVGLDVADPSDRNGSKDPYARMGFFKLLDEKCINLEGRFVELLNIDSSSDPTGIVSLVEQMSAANCNFGYHLGSSNNSTYKAAVVYYQYATQFENDIRLLDGNEVQPAVEEYPEGDFKIVRSNDFSQVSNPWPSTVTDWLDRTDTSQFFLQGLSNIPAAGAYSFNIPAISGTLPEDYTAELSVDIEGAGQVIVSLMSEDSDNFAVANPNAGPLDGKTHDWYTATSSNSSYRYGSANGVPELFVTIVNPSLEDQVSVEVSFNILEEMAPSLDLEQPIFIEGDPGTVGDGQLITGTSYTIGFLRTATRYNPDPYPFLSEGTGNITLSVYGEAPILGYESYIFFGLSGDQCDFVLRTINTRVTELNLPEPTNIPGVYGNLEVAELLADFSAQGCNGSASDLYVRQVQVSAFFGGDMPLDAFAIGNGELNVLEYTPTP